MSVQIGNYQHVLVQYVRTGVVEVRLNRPGKRNAMNNQLWKEVGHCFEELLPAEQKCGCVLLTGAGSIFSAGIDLKGAFQMDTGGRRLDTARLGMNVLREGGHWQRSWKAINNCDKPVIACIHGGCFGAALEMIAFADIRFCTKDCVFQAPEVDLGLAADIGGNQLLPKIVGNDSLLRELQLSGRKLHAAEALSFGLVSRVLKDQTELMENALEIASSIAAKSPIAVLGTKQMLNFTRDHTVDDSLRFGLTWNSSMVQTDDMARAGKAFMEKSVPSFEPVLPLKEPMSKI
jgi:delta(3,5)-delta(2,4)-dienoyl-CoA isomerase